MLAASAVRPGSSTLANITLRPLTRGTASENVCGGGWALATAVRSMPSAGAPVTPSRTIWTMPSVTLPSGFRQVALHVPANAPSRTAVVQFQAEAPSDSGP